MQFKEFPHEEFINFEGEPDFLGRITILKVHSGYNAEVDIVQQETKKIYKNVTIVYNQSTALEALEQGIQKLSHFLSGKSI